MSNYQQMNGSAEMLLTYEDVVRGKKAYLVIRRVQDIVLSSIALIVLLPLMLLIALCIVIDSPGASPIFVQTRVGKDGKLFRFYKFRSMCPNAEEKLQDLIQYNEMTGPVFKIKADPRITRVGHIIRKTSLDELPQLLNILLGDMTIVGPRPALPREVEQYNLQQRQRLLVHPGLTCFWQIQPNRNDCDFGVWLDLDLKYIRERSLATDWKIIFGTMLAVLRMDGI